MTDYFQLLPPEITVHILQFLPSDTLINSVSLVSKAFREHVFNAITAVEYFYIRETAAAFSRFIKELTSLQTLYLAIGFPDIDFFEDMDLPSSPSVRELVIRSNGSYLIRITTFRAYPNLQSLKLYGVYLPSSEESDYYDVDDIKHCALLRQEFKKLRKLTISNMYGASSFNFSGCLGDSLRELKIREMPLLEPSDYEAIANNCQLLEKFHSKTFCDVHTVLVLLVFLPLKDFKITYEMPTFLYRSKSPKELIKSERHMLYFFSRMTGLEKCGFTAAQEIDDVVLGYMAKHCARLKCLKVSKLDRITNTGIVDLISSLKCLKELHIVNCIGCSKEGIASHISPVRKMNIFRCE